MGGRQHKKPSLALLYSRAFKGMARWESGTMDADHFHGYAANWRTAASPSRLTLLLPLLFVSPSSLQPPFSREISNSGLERKRRLFLSGDRTRQIDPARRNQTSIAPETAEPPDQAASIVFFKN